MSDADLVVLSLLAEQPRHGYDIEQVIEARGYREWTSLAFSSIYYVLKRLQERGWIRPTEGAPSRRAIFELTPEGREQLVDAAMQRVETPERPSSSVLPALGAYAALDDPGLRAALARRAEATGIQLEWLRAAMAASDSAHARAIFDYVIRQHEADLAWARDLLDGKAP